MNTADRFVGHIVNTRTGECSKINVPRKIRVSRRFVMSFFTPLLELYQQAFKDRQSSVPYVLMGLAERMRHGTNLVEININKFAADIKIDSYACRKTLQYLIQKKAIVELVDLKHTTIHTYLVNPTMYFVGDGLDEKTVLDSWHKHHPFGKEGNT